MTIGGNAFIVNSISAGMKVNVKNPELQYSRDPHTDAEQDGFWDWVI